MMQTVFLNDLGRVVTGKTPPNDKPELWGEELDFITPTDFTNSRYIKPKRKLSRSGSTAFHRIICPADSVIVTCIGSAMGKVAISKKPFVSNQQINSIIVDSKKTNPFFVYYLLTSNHLLLRKHAENSGSTMPIINKSAFERLSFDIPDLESQNKIADILGTLDEKIELNCKMNETLEQIGQALFRHYFIDNPEAKEWKYETVSEIVDIYSGFAFKSKDFNSQGSYGLVTIKNVQDSGFVTECTDRLADPLPEKVPAYAHLADGDIIMSLTGNVGRVCLVMGKRLLLNQRVAKLVGKEDFRTYAYFLFRSNEMRDRLIGISRGTAQMNLSPVDTKNLKIAIPNINTAKRFEEIASRLVDRIIANNSQIQTLTTLRDTLLPKLVSGKIKVD